MDSIVERLKKVFSWIEGMDMCVGELWLHPKQIEELKDSSDPGLDLVHRHDVRLSYFEEKGAVYVAMFWGAMVFASVTVVEGHVAALPRGWKARLIDSSACMSL